MEIGFEKKYWLQGPAAPANGGECSDAPEWPELRARLGAAWSARRELGLCGGNSAWRSGSFDCASASTLAHFAAASPAVNPIALGNLKPREGNAGEHTGVSSPGGRG
jgi:hypothetical protein